MDLVRSYKLGERFRTTLLLDQQKEEEDALMGNKAYIPGSVSSKTEVIYTGLGVSRGIAIGPAYVYTRDELHVDQRKIKSDEIDVELSRFRWAVERSLKELRKITSVAKEKLGDQSAGIFEAQSLMLQDVDFLYSVEERIKHSRNNCSYAIQLFITESRRRMEASGNEYFQERANDLLDVQDRLIRNLHQRKLLSAIEPNSVVISRNLTAADIILFSRRNILGCAMNLGGPTSHVSLMARGLGVPAVINIHKNTSFVESGDPVILDGFNGRLIVHPTEETVAAYKRLQEHFEELLEDEKALVPLSSETLDGESVQLMANLEFIEEIDLVKKYGAQGIGLFRTEFLFLMNGLHDYDEEAQYKTYKRIVTEVAPNATTFRLLDLGGDKMLPMAHREHNPFLGWRGIRILLDKPELLRRQMKALLRASAEGPLRILVPMVSNLNEVYAFKKIFEETKCQLRNEGVGFDENVPIGIMVEVPSVALMADKYAKEVDFFSIGTNDLTQYLLAVDRGNNMVSDLYQEMSPSVLKTIRDIVLAAERNGIPVSICGELASDPLATAILLGLGIREFSASPTFLPEIKRVVRSMRRSEAELLSEQALDIFDAGLRKKTLMKWIRDHAPDYYAFLCESENSSPE